MKRFPCRTVFFLLLSVAVPLALTTPTALAQRYTFTRIAEVGGTNALNDSGVVALRTVLAPNGEGIYAGSGGAPASLYDTSGGTFTNFSLLNLALSNNNVVAFEANRSGTGTGIYAGNGGPTVTIATTSGSFDRFGTPAINMAGQVAFPVVFDLENNFGGIYLGSGGPLTTIADNLGPLNVFGSSVALNESGTVSFRATLDAGGNGIFTGNGGALTTIADTNGIFNRFGQHTGINATGRVVFQGFLNAGGEGIYVGNGGPVTTVADSSGPFSSFGLASLNDSGDVAFFANLDVGGSGIYTGSDPTADKVVSVGDTLDGANVILISSFLKSLNNSGQIVFQAVLSDGRHVTYRADPIPATVEGWIQIESATTLTVPVTIEFRPTNGTAAFTQQVTLASDGSFFLGNLPRKEYQLAIHAPHTLQRVITVDARLTNVTGINAELLAGDANADNSIDLLDLAILIETFDTQLGDPNWDASADFNYDDSVDTMDLAVLLTHFDMQGDP